MLADGAFNVGPAPATRVIGAALLVGGGVPVRWYGKAAGLSQAGFLPVSAMPGAAVFI